ncbi:CCA tRNA nucleotidyltransferase [Kiritimatiellaeota bacterium B1221]|nr:CCA tRNA nucleotidyltransferase [Kiritimatiellaeota bacterium B1221]
MTETTLPTPSELRKKYPAAMKVADSLHAAGFLAYFAGGCVRDMLLARSAKDIDIASSARPDQVEDLFPHTHAIGKSFGVIQVVMDGEVFEVATFRQDLTYQDGRHPEGYEPSSPEADASRRDFTINGMFLHPQTGELIDHTGGSDDLKSGTLRAIGDPDLRFREDHLRLLRAIRFASVLEFKIEDQTWKAICRDANLLQKVSVERIRQEFVRLLTESPQAGEALTLLRDSGLLNHILPEMLDTIGCDQPPEYHPEGDVWNHTVMMLNELNQPSEELALSILLHDIGKPATRTVDPDGRIRFQGHAQVGAEMAEAWLLKMKFSKALRNTVTGLVYRHMDMISVPQMRKATLRKIVARDCFEDELELHRIDCLCSNGITASTERLLEARKEYEIEAALPAPWIRGKDLLALGLVPGPEIGRWKDLAYEHQLEGSFATPEDLKRWLRDELRNRSN